MIPLYKILVPIIISMLPFFELRGGVILAIAYGFPPLLAFIICTVSNSLAVPLVYFFLNLLHEKLMNLSFYRRRIDRYIEKYRHKFSDIFSNREIFLYLMAFTAIPIPGTGAYTASLLAWLFNVKKRIAYPSIILGVVIAGILVTLATVGVINVF